VLFIYSKHLRKGLPAADSSAWELLRAVSRAAKIHIGMEIKGQESPLAGGRLIWPQRTRLTSNIEKGLLPPQKLSGTLLAVMATVWNGLPEAIKSEQRTRKNLLHSAVTYNRDKFEL
jgi:hypothetical protein